MDSPDPRGGVPLHEAAELLGVTVELLRKRAQRKTVPAYKVDGRWYVVLDGVQNVQDRTSPGPVRDRTGSPGQDVLDNPPPPPSTVSPAARSQLEAIRDEWLRPLVDRIGELEREAGQLQERVAGVERERDAVARERDDVAAHLADDRKLADQLVNVLQAERDAALAEVERLRAGQGHPHVAREPQREAEPAGATPDPSRSWWRRVLAWLRGA